MNASRRRRRSGIHSLQRKDDVNAPEHENAFLDLHLADSHRLQLITRRTDAARLQRAPQGAEQSTSGRRNQVVDRGRVRVGNVSLDPIMAGNRPVSPEAHGF